MPGGCNTPRGVSSQPEQAGHAMCLIGQGDWQPLSSGPSFAWRWRSSSAGLHNRQRAALRS